jgi:hypothetical protein
MPRKLLAEAVETARRGVVIVIDGPASFLFDGFLLQGAGRREGAAQGGEDARGAFRRRLAPLDLRFEPFELAQGAAAEGLGDLGEIHGGAGSPGAAAGTKWSGTVPHKAGSIPPSRRAASRRFSAITWARGGQAHVRMRLRRVERLTPSWAATSRSGRSGRPTYIDHAASLSALLNAIGVIMRFAR